MCHLLVCNIRTVLFMISNFQHICYLLYDGQILDFIDLTHLLLKFMITKIMQFYIINVFKFLTTG